VRPRSFILLLLVYNLCLHADARPYANSLAFHHIQSQEAGSFP